jgi:hypothetical protein
MADIPRKLLRDGFERLVKKGAQAISAEEVNVQALVRDLVKSVRGASSSATEAAHEIRESERSLGASVINIVRSVDSFGDLEARIRAHRSDFARLARSVGHQIVAVLDDLSEPLDHSVAKKDEKARAQLPSSLSSKEDEER